MRTIDQYFDEFTSVNGSNIGYPVMYDYPENEPDPILDSYIQFEDPEAEKVMVNAFGKNGKLTYRQAKNVTDKTWIQTFGVSIKGLNYTQILVDPFKNISKFNEFKYFTGLKNPFAITSDLKLAAFINSKSLEEITFPDTITRVAKASFYMCSKLNKVTLGKNIKIFDPNCFYKCSNLTTIIGGENLQIVNDYALYENTNLTNISGLDVSKLTHIGDYAFFSTKLFPSFTKDGLINLDNIIGLKGNPFGLDPSNIPNNIKHITLKLGKNLNNIINNNNGFSNIFGVHQDLDSSIKYSIELNPENKYLTLNKYDGYQVLLLPLKEVVTNTKKFQKINKAYVPSTNTDNLYVCMDTGLDENYPSVIKYPEGIEMMMAGSTRGIFQTTDKLMTIVFPESLKHIGDRFMQYANSVETLVFKSTEPPLCNEIFISFNKNLTKVYVPKASIDKYKNNFKYILGHRTNQQLLAIEDMPEDLKAKLL